MLHGCGGGLEVGAWAGLIPTKCQHTCIFFCEREGKYVSYHFEIVAAQLKLGLRL